MRKIWVWTIFLGFLYAPSLKAASLSEVQKALDQTSSFQAHFTQKTYNTFSNKTQTHQGLVSWQRPGLMRWQYQEPEPLLIVVGKDRVFLYDSLLENVTISDRSEVSRLKLLGFLFGGVNLNSLYRPGPPPSFPLEKGNWLHLEPLQPDTELKSLHLLLEEGQLSRFVLVTPQGNWRSFEFKDFKNNPKLPSSEF